MASFVPRCLQRRFPSDYDDVLKITKHEDAAEYVASAFAESTADEVLGLERYYLGKKLFDLKYGGREGKKTGGNQGDETEDTGDDTGDDLDDDTYERLYPEDLGKLDIRLYRLMELVDAIHDFADTRPSPGQAASEVHEENVRLRKYLSESLQASLPSEISDMNSIANKTTFIKTMSKHKVLHFGDDGVENPLYGRDIESGVYRHVSENKENDAPAGKVTRMRFWKPSSGCSRGTFSSEEVFCETGKRKLIVLEEIVRVRKSMQAFFCGSPLRLMVDQSLVPRDMGVEESMHGVRSMPHLFAWMTGFETLLDEMRRLFFKRKYDRVTGAYVDQELSHFASHVPQYRSKFTTRLEMVSCDASVYDGSRWLDAPVIDDRTGLPDRFYAPPGTPESSTGVGREFGLQDRGGWFKHRRAPNVSSLATGEVFHPKGTVTLKFDMPATRSGYGYVVKTADAQWAPVDLRNPGSGRDTVAKVVKDGAFQERAGLEGRGPKALERHDRSSMETYVYDWSWSDPFVSCAVPLALKRAGDWGQVEHCKRNGVVFVTADKLAALYAAYRDVPCMYMKYHVKGDNDIQEYNGASKPDGTYEKIKFVQYSFVMCGSRRSRASGNARQSGGVGTSDWAPATLLAVVVVASAFMT